jgi:asparagine synthetase B (glutamine-hydrolysing)
MGRGVDGFFWSVSDERGDELEFASAVAEKSGFGLTTIPCDLALPFAGIATWPVHPATPEQNAYRRFHELTYERVAQLGHRVVLTGLGGDALYGNAPRWFWTMLFAEGVGHAVDRLRERAVQVGWRQAVRSHLLSPLLPRGRALRRSHPTYLTPLALELLSASPSWPRDASSFRRPRQAERVLSLLESRACELERWYAARWGLEIRWPLRDPDLVDFVLATPDHLFVQGQESRPVLRAATTSLLPEPVRLRRGKASFRFAIEKGLLAANIPWASSLLLDEGALWRGLVEEGAVRSWIAGEIGNDLDLLGYLQCLFAEIWRFRRNGGELAALARFDPPT